MLIMTENADLTEEQKLLIAIEIIRAGGDKNEYEIHYNNQNFKVSVTYFFTTVIMIEGISK